MTLNNSKQKINDVLGKPCEIGIAVMWRVTDTARLVNVDNYKVSFFAMRQCYSAISSGFTLTTLHRILMTGPETESRMRATSGGSSSIVAGASGKKYRTRSMLQVLRVIEARITYLAYASEIAAVYAARQQASILLTRKMIVDGAVGMVRMALEKLNRR